MDPGQELELVVNYLRKNPDTAAATSVCHISAGLLAAKADSGKSDLIITGYDLDAQALDASQGRASGVHDRPATVLARLYASPAVDPLSQIRAG